MWCFSISCQDKSIHVKSKAFLSTGQKKEKQNLQPFAYFSANRYNSIYSFAALYLKKKKSLFPYLLPLQVLLFSDTMTRPHDKNTNQGWDLCKFYISAKFHQNNSPRGLTGEIQQKTISHFSKPKCHKIHLQKPHLSLNLSQTLVLAQHL